MQIIYVVFLELFFIEVKDFHVFFFCGEGDIFKMRHDSRNAGC